MIAYYDKASALWGLRCDDKDTTPPLFLEVFDIKEGLAAVRYADGTTGVVDGQGTTVLRLSHSRQLGFAGHDFLKVVTDQDCYIDLRSQEVYAHLPESRWFGSFELLYIGGYIYTRTHRIYGVRDGISHPCLCAGGLYLTLPCDLSPMAASADGMPGAVPRWLGNRYYGACLLAGDDTRVYWFYTRLLDDTIVVMDDESRLFHVTGCGDGQLKAVKRLVAQADAHSSREEIDRLLQPLADAIQAQVEEQERLRLAEEEGRRLQRLLRMRAALPFRSGLKWGLQLDGRVIVPPLYRSLQAPVGIYCAVECNPRQWGVMAVDGRMVVEPKYEQVQIYKNGTAELTIFHGKKVRVSLH